MRRDSPIRAGSEANRAALEAQRAGVAQSAEHRQAGRGIAAWSGIKAPSGAASLPRRLDRLMDEVGPGPSRGDGTGGRVGFDNDLTGCNITIMTRKLLPLARMLRDGGRDRTERAMGPRFGFEAPQYRS